MVGIGMWQWKRVAPLSFWHSFFFVQNTKSTIVDDRIKNNPKKGYGVGGRVVESQRRDRLHLNR
jgi:hypothetical protein